MFPFLPGHYRPNRDHRPPDHAGPVLRPRRRYSGAVHSRQFLIRHLVGRDHGRPAAAVTVAIAPDHARFRRRRPGRKIDATRGMRDFVDDALALMDHLGHERFHLVGVSLGGLVAWWMMADAPERLLSVTLAGPGSPFGFGGTRDARRHTDQRRLRRFRRRPDQPDPGPGPAGRRPAPMAAVQPTQHAASAGLGRRLSRSARTR